MRVLLTLLALAAGRVVPAGSQAGEIWPDDLPGNPDNALQTRLGPDEFQAAYEYGRALSQDAAVALAASTIAHPVKAG